MMPALTDTAQPPPNDTELSPVLQILHVSDLHLRHDGFELPNRLEDALRRLRAIKERMSGPVTALGTRGVAFDARLRGVVAELEHGLYGHDRDALDKLIDWVRIAVAPDPQWRGVPSWVIDTGDQSTFGDDASLELGADTLNQLSEALGGHGATRIHGNHDAWPEMPPFLASEDQITAQRARLRTAHFVAEYPCSPALAHTAETGNLSIDVYQLNSVVHGRVRNGLARGVIREDGYWKTRPAGTPRQGVQLAKLEALCAQRREAHDRPTLRIVLVHHPLRHGQRQRFAMKLEGARKHHHHLSRRRLDLDGGPLAHLVLSGHTHQLYPKLGRFGVRRRASRTELSDQLVVGTAAQLPMKVSDDIDRPEPPAAALTTDDLFPQQVQLLRFWRPTHSSEEAVDWVAVDRITIGRANGIGEWGVIPVGKTSRRYERRWIRL